MRLQPHLVSENGSIWNFCVEPKFTLTKKLCKKQNNNPIQEKEYPNSEFETIYQPRGLFTIKIMCS